MAEELTLDSYNLVGLYSGRPRGVVSLPAPPPLGSTVRADGYGWLVIEKRGQVLGVTRPAYDEYTFLSRSREKECRA